MDGIVAKDYLGESSSHDMTPLDTDVWKITEDNGSLESNLKEIRGIRNYISGNTSNKNLGKIILAFDGSNYVETRNEKYEESQEAISQCIDDRSKSECFYNWGRDNNRAYGIRTGIGSTNIKYIIADKYVEKLGLEIAINGFYIPIIDEKRNVLYTPEMYQEFREKMQGISYYGEKDFRVDETARNPETERIVKYIELNKKESDSKREKIMRIFENVAKKMKLKISEKRNVDLIPGIIELIDTGSTGRGTNEPGDGDFDFMVRVDRDIYDNPEKIKQLIKEELSQISVPENSTETVNGDFRYKGVTIDGLDKKLDIDLTYSIRSNDIEYSTEECIKDRLKTIQNNSEEDYKYVVANILLAKKFLKTEGVYKKANAPAPEKGKMDTRGGLGAVGIENWILQNGGSFEIAAESFLKEAGCIDEKGNIVEENEIIPFQTFQKKYFIWDFGANWISSEKDIYSHDNFVDNMTEDGYKKMTSALIEYVKVKDRGQEDNRIGIADIVKQDMNVIGDTTYIKSVRAILEKSKAIENNEIVK